MKSHSPFGLPLALPFGILVFLVVISLIATANRKAVNKIEVVPASGSVTRAVPSGAAPESATTTTVEVASSPSPDKTGEVRRISFTVRPRLGNGTNR